MKKLVAILAAAFAVALPITTAASAPAVGDTVTWTNADGLTADDVVNANHCSFSLQLPESDSLPAGSVVRITNVQFASINSERVSNSSNNLNDPHSISIGNTRSSEVSFITSETLAGKYIDSYDFSNGVEVKVGRKYDESWGAAYTQFAGCGVTFLHSNGNRWSGGTTMNCTVGGTTSGVIANGGTIFPIYKITAVVVSIHKDVEVGANTTASSINGMVGDATDVAIAVADGVTITVDAAFNAAIKSVTSAGSITLSAASQPDASYFANVDFSGVQGSLLRSWLTPGVVGVNFHKAQGNVVSGELVKSDNWVSTTGANGTSTALFADGLTKVTWSASGTYSYFAGDDESVSFLHGYLDDGSNKGNGVEIYVDGVPFETYDVVIYASTDTSGAKFQAKTVNGLVYTVDSLGAVSSGSSVWGLSRLEVPAYGANAMRIKNLSGPLAIYGGLNTYSSDKARGGIAAIQILPPSAEDNVTEYTLALDGTTTVWSTGAWKVGTEAASAPLAGHATITLISSTTLIVDSDVSLTQLVIEGEDDAVLTLVTSGGTIAAKASVVVKGGVLKQGSEAVLGATPSVVIQAGATFDMNGLGINPATAVMIAGAGAGNWPWALTSSSGAGGAILGGLYLSANATIGGANELKVGKTDNGYYCYLQGFTLTKTGEGAFTATNMNTPGTGTIDVHGGAMTVNTWNNLNSSSGDTDVILRSGTSLENKTDRVISMRTLTLDGGTLLTTSKAFKVKTILTGKGETAKLAFADGATINLTGELTVSSELVLDGSLTISTAGINPAEIEIGQIIDLLTAPSETTLSSDTITVQAGPRYETEIIGNKVIAIVVEPKKFMHYDFNAANSIAADSTYNFGNLNPAFVTGKNGNAGVFDSSYKPYYGSNTSNKSPFYAGEMTVTTLLKVKEASNTILWNFGSGWSVGMALIAKDSSTISVVSWTGGAAGSDVVSVTGIADLMNKWHLVTIVANANGTTLYVDGTSATVGKVLPSGISGQGQFGSIHGTAKNYNAVSGDGYLLDDWRVYDAALTAKEVRTIKSSLLPDAFNIRLR